MGDDGAVWTEIWKQLKEDREKGFESFYIVTYQKIYGIIVSAVGDHERAERLLKDFYIRLFHELESGPEEEAGEEDVIRWMEEFLHQQFGIRSSGEREEKYLPGEKAATLFFEIEEGTGLGEKEESRGGEEENIRKKSRRRKLMSSGAAAGILFLAFWGTWMAREMISRWGRSMKVVLATETQVPVPEFAGRIKDDGENGKLEQPMQGEELTVGSWTIFLSEEGEILEERKADRPVSHGTVQEAAAGNGDEWTIMLLEEEAFPDADSGLRDSLICRLKGQSGYGVIGEAVEDFCIRDHTVYYAVADGVKTESLTGLEWLEQKDPGSHLMMKNDGFYLFNDFGEPETESHVADGDRILRVDAGRIKYVRQSEIRLNGTTFFLAEADGDPGNELCAGDGSREFSVIHKGKRWIDSFCRVGEWIYFSEYEEMDENKYRYSAVYRMRADGSGMEQVTDLFRGNVTAMYYFPEEGVIYGEFKPDSYRSYYGQIVRISLDGNMEVLDDPSARSSWKTEGNDMLELLDVENGTVFCYWHDCRVNGTEVSVLRTMPMTMGRN